MENVNIEGDARISRTVDSEQSEALVMLTILLNARDAIVRIGTQLRGFRHPVSLWTLREIDSMLEAIMYANRPIKTYFKGEAAKTVSRTSDLFPPPVDYVWCPECLGCLERSQTCVTCDGDRVVRHG